MKTEELTGDNIMPFGTHWGKTLKEVPGEYFLHIYRNYQNLRPDLKRYIEAHLDEFENKFIKSLPHETRTDHSFSPSGSDGKSPAS